MHFILPSVVFPPITQLPQLAAVVFVDQRQHLFPDYTWFLKNSLYLATKRSLSKRNNLSLIIPSFKSLASVIGRKPVPIFLEDRTTTYLDGFVLLES